MAIDFDVMTPAQRKWYGGPQSKPNKYRARRTEYNGVWYDSKAEAEYAEELDWFVEAKHVSWWLRQVPIPLGPDFKTRIDFQVATRYSIGFPVWVKIHGAEVKGVETREFRKVRQLWPKYGPFPLHIVKGTKVEIIEGKA